MFKIEGNEIYITKGDTGIIDFTLDNYTFVNGDRVFFSVKKSKSDRNYTFQKVINTFSDNAAKIIITKSDSNIEKGRYWYDIQCNLADGRVDTVITPNKFVVMEEITND